MAALLVAYGRGVERGASLGRVSNLAVAPTVLRLLGLPVPPQMKAAPIPQLLRGIDETARPGSTAPAETSEAPASRGKEDRK